MELSLPFPLLGLTHHDKGSYNYSKAGFNRNAVWLKEL